MTNRIHFSGMLEQDKRAQRKLTDTVESLDPDAPESLPDWIAYGYVLSERQSIFVAYTLHHDWGVHADSLDALIEKIHARFPLTPPP